MLSMTLTRSSNLDMMPNPILPNSLFVPIWFLLFSFPPFFVHVTDVKLFMKVGSALNNAEISKSITMRLFSAPDNVIGYGSGSKLLNVSTMSWNQNWSCSLIFMHMCPHEMFIESPKAYQECLMNIFGVRHLWKNENATSENI